MSFDREVALKSAEKAIRQGRVDAAIAHFYVHIIAAESRKLRRDDVLFGRLVHVDRRDPARRIRRKSIQSLLEC